MEFFLWTFVIGAILAKVIGFIILVAVAIAILKSI